MTPRFLIIPLVLIAMLCFGIKASAQDVIYLKDGTTVKAKVKEVSQRQIEYRKWDNQNGPIYVVSRRDVDYIVYENGTTEYMDGRNRNADEEDSTDNRDILPPSPMRSHRNREATIIPGYGKNIIAIAPIHMTNESPAGVGVSYERVLDKRGILSLYLPIAIAFFTEEDNGVPTTSINRTFTYLYPGVKLYPAGSSHAVTYSVGPSFGFGFGEKNKESVVQQVDPNTGAIYYQTQYTKGSVFKAGIMVNNGINIQPTKKLYLGLEFGIGFMYADNERANFYTGDEPIVQFNFKMGYRF